MARVVDGARGERGGPRRARGRGAASTRQRWAQLVASATTAQSSRTREYRDEEASEGETASCMTWTRERPEALREEW